MKKYNKYTILFLLVILGISSSIYAQDTTTEGSASVSTNGVDLKTSTKIELEGLRVDKKDNFEKMRVEKLEKDETMRRDRNDEIMKLRDDTRLKVESGGIKAGEAYKVINTQAKDLREKTRLEIEKNRNDFKLAVKEDREKAKEMIDEKRNSLLLSILDRRVLFKQEFEIRKEEMKMKREEMKAKFQADLLKIKDENKREKVEKISDNFAEINIRSTTKASVTVDKIEAVLISIESRTDKVAVNGADVTNIRALILKSETAIYDARMSIEAQVSKVYTTSISGDATIKASLVSTRDQLKTDLQLMKNKVKAAHDSTKKVLELLKTVPNVDAQVEVVVENNSN